MDELPDYSLFNDKTLVCLTTDKSIRRTHWLFVIFDEDYKIGKTNIDKCTF